MVQSLVATPQLVDAAQLTPDAYFELEANFDLSVLTAARAVNPAAVDVLKTHRGDVSPMPKIAVFGNAEFRIHHGNNEFVHIGAFVSGIREVFT